MRTKQKGNLQITMVASCTYFIFIFILWLPFGPHQGMGYETTLVYFSETSSVLDGFIYHGDPLKPHTSTFYHISYLLGKVLGMEGSFFPYQIIYILLWWARGIIVFLIIRKILSENSFFAYLVGTLVIAHACDGSLMWVGQLNQFGYIFWLLFAFYMFVLAVYADNLPYTYFFLSMAVIFEYMSLWSYESQLFIMLAAPFIVLFNIRKSIRRYLAIASLWYIMPIIYIIRAALHYWYSAGQSYQESIIRRDLSKAVLVNDWIFNIVASLQFWKWNRVQMMVEQPGMVQLTHGQLIVLAILTVGIFMGGGVATVYLQKRERGQMGEALPRNHSLWVILGIGLLLLIFSFPAYLLLNTARSLWRTQFLSGIGAAVVMGAVVSLAANYLLGLWSKVNTSAQKGMNGSEVWLPYNVRVLVTAMTCLLLAASIIFAGSFSAIKLGAFHYAVWERHRRVISQVLQIAPQVKPETVVVLTNVPKEDDPFGNNMWFDVALWLAYPETPVVGIYFYEDGAPSPGSNLKLHAHSWEWDQTGWLPRVRGADTSSTIVIRYDKQGIATLMRTLPSFLNPDERARALYHPVAAIKSNLPEPRAARRYILTGRISEQMNLIRQ
jgi:hypothetical protein